MANSGSDYNKMIAYNMSTQYQDALMREALRRATRIHEAHEQSTALRRVVSKRDAKRHAVGPRRQRAGLFQWALNTSAKRPPARYAWGVV